MSTIMMAQYRRNSYALTFLVLAVLFSSLVLSVSTTGVVSVAQTQGQGATRLADVSPSIYNWGITGRPNMSEPFTVWANVTDDDLDLANVSVYVNGPNTTIHELMSYNGSLYVEDLDALLDAGTYDIYVTATDLANNTRVSRHEYIELQMETTTVVDPNITMPYVVASSLCIGLVACIVAYLYRQRQLAGST
ncbi:MAG: hypothetical protein C4K48_04410 [Candidatus Thorarchaeota archaeon]|nr:MAG: hypothetical protein C4K48_04410 [Candidatus Thorarchaeota archaeon]